MLIEQLQLVHGTPKESKMFNKNEKRLKRLKVNAEFYNLPIRLQNSFFYFFNVYIILSEIKLLI